MMNFGGLITEIYTYVIPSGYVKKDKNPCHLLFTAVGITCEGYLTACGCVDFQNYLIVADLNKVSLQEGWYGEKFTELRKRYMEDKLEGLQCYNCVYGKTEPFEPLTKEYASIISMDEIYTDKYIKARLKANNMED